MRAFIAVLLLAFSLPAFGQGKNQGKLVEQGVPYSGGQVLLPDGSAGTPSLSFAADKNVGVYRSGADELSLSTAGTQRLSLGTATLTLTVNETIPAAGVFAWNGRAHLLSTADGKLKLSNAAENSGVVLNFTGDVLNLRNYADSAYAQLNVLGVVAYGTIYAAGNQIYYSTAGGAGWFYQAERTSDAATGTITTMGGNAYALASSNTAGGSLNVRGGIGTRFINATDYADAAGDAIVFTVNGSATTKTEGTDFTCVGTSNAQCACAIYALSISGVVMTRTDGTCSDGRVGFQPSSASTRSLTVSITNNAADPFGTVTSGADGQVLIGDGSSTAPSLGFGLDTDTGIYRVGTNELGLVATTVTVPTGSAISYSAKTKMSSPADGQFKLTNAAGSAGMVLKFDGGIIQILDLAGSGYQRIKTSAYAVSPQTITCATSGDGAHSTCGGAQTITASQVQLVCNDADGCTLTLAETGFGATETLLVTLVGPAASHVDVDDSAGVLELGAAGSMAMDALDTLTIIYLPAATTWAEVARSAN